MTPTLPTAAPEAAPDPALGPAPANGPVPEADPAPASVAPGSAAPTPGSPRGDLDAAAVPAAGPGAAPKKKKKKRDDVAPDPDDTFRELGSKRGVETLFRTSYQVNMDLTALADTKANIMISINGLMISILIAQIASKVESNPWLYIPTAVFVVGCLVSLIFAVLAARPRVMSTAVTLDDVRQRRSNLLFFGNFAYLTADEFSTAMRERVADPADIYGMMLNDIHGVGSVLQRKYRMISASYASFMVALVLGVAAFVGVLWYATTLDAALLDPPTVIYQPAPVAP